MIIASTLDFNAMLLESIQELSSGWCTAPGSRLDFLGESLFDFTTYDNGMTELFARKAVEFIQAVNNRTTFEYIKDQDNYQWYLIMANMPFFANKLDWGGSIRGAWWARPHQHRTIEISTCDLWYHGEQLDTISFTLDEWTKFMAAVVEFAAPGMTEVKNVE